MRADKQFILLIALILLSGVATAVHLVQAQPESLRSSQYGVPFLAHSIRHPDTGECLTANQLAAYFLN
ncbi:MAG: hypothetical protein EBZ14_07325 [Gammaproteobacteria bacterium]|jgi:hypothetical protein|nr:hypothetical protein [Gammaproteobacteria bacterium]NDA15045.1 hypothetical protein [Gammaproteobacteria bacterium]NDG44405.1 hypothetical protein [Gammaproteobacteria bacterium]